MKSSSVPSLATVLAGSAVAVMTGGAVAQSQFTSSWNTTLSLSGSALHGRMISRSADDSIYVTGHYPNYRIVTARLAADGTLQWQRDFANAGTREHASWLTVDAFGDVLVAGYHVTGASMTPNGFVTLKYDAAGNLLWSQLVQSTWSRLQRVVTDGNGDVIVVGRTFAAVGAGIVTIKYSRQGALLWTATNGLSAANQDEIGDVAIDGNGNVYVAAGVIGTMLTLSYDPAGNLRWARTTPAMGSGLDLALAGNDVYVVGVASGTGAARNLVVKYDNLGTPSWSNTYPGSGARRLEIDSQGNLVVIGTRTVGGGYMDWSVQKVAPNGSLVWSAVLDQHQYNDEIPQALTIGPGDEIYVTGQGGPGPTSGTLSYVRTVTARFRSDGLQEAIASTFDSVRGLGVVRLTDNSLATIGESPFTVFGYEQSGVWYTIDGALAGTSQPRLRGGGSPSTGQVATMVLDRGPGLAPGLLVGGISRLELPFLGGTLVPFPDAVLPISLAANGAWTTGLPWPPLPTGFEVTFQAWVLDSGAPAGYAASNGLVAQSRL